jgi:hypothetical protein
VWFEGLDEFGCFVWRDDGLRAGGGGGKGGALLRERDVQLRLGGGGGGWGVVGGGGGVLTNDGLLSSWSCLSLLISASMVSSVIYVLLCSIQGSQL